MPNINKVVFGEEILIDLTDDTVVPENLQEGATAHRKDGSIIRGTANYGGAAPCTVLVVSSFSTGSTYKAGDRVIYNGALYRFTSNHPAGAWNSGHVTSVNIDKELTKVKTDMYPGNVPFIASNQVFNSDVIQTISPSERNQGAWRETTQSITSGSYQHYVYTNLSYTAQRVKAFVSGYSFGADWPLIVFKDSNNNTLECGYMKPFYEYSDAPIIIPSNTSKIIINSNSTFDPVLKIINETDEWRAINVAGSGIEVTDQVVIDNPDLSDLITFPKNKIYNISASAISSIANLPPNFNYGTVFKFTGRKYATSDGYDSFLVLGRTNPARNNVDLWYGFVNVANGVQTLWWRDLTEDLDNIQSTLNGNKRYLFIGDSYGDGYSHDGSNPGWISYCVDYMGLSSSDYVSSHRGGAKFSLTDANTFKSLIPGDASSTAFTDIVVCGGFNDYGQTEANILNGISDFISTCKTRFPNALVHIGCVGYIKAGTGEGAYSNWQDVRSAIETKVVPCYQKASIYGGSYLNNVEYWLNDSLMTNSDGYHPGAEGNQSIGAAVANALLTGSAPLPYKSSLRL